MVEAAGPNTSEERDLWGGAVAPGAPLQRGEWSEAEGARGASTIRNLYPYLYPYPYPYPFLSLVLSFLMLGSNI